MSRVFQATCENGIVKIGNFVIQDAVILSLGNAPSSTGVLIIEGGVSYFSASSAPDIKALIESMVAIIDKVILIATGLDAVTTTPASQAANIAELTVLKTELNLTKDTLI
jgi:hypothetical protein